MILKNEHEVCVMLSSDQFQILYHLYRAAAPVSQRTLAAAANISLGKTNLLVSELKSAGLIGSDGAITAAGLSALQPYKVDNAIILAAGFSSRCAPLSYEKPKGLFKVKGEVLIERQIRQLQAAGIRQIYVVVGYMKELFFYLEEKFGVKIVINNEYVQRNNLSSVMAASEYLGNSFLCYSDNYITKDGYEPYVYRSYFAAQYSVEYTDEYAMKFDNNGLLHQYYQGDAACWYQMGEMYFDRNTSRRFLELLRHEYSYPSIYDMKIDDFYIRHLSEFEIYIKKYPENTVVEFDTIAEIQRFDSQFIQNLGENILTNICTTLSCSEEEITGIQQIKRGMTNIIFRFECKGKKYIYRHPGRGTGKIIDRALEYIAQRAAAELGLDTTLIKADPKKGWKISRYVEHVDFDYRNLRDEEQGIALIRRLHSTHRLLGWDFDMIARATQMQTLVPQEYYDAYREFAQLRADAERLYRYAEQDGFPKEMCHNDACDSNILLGREETCLIDWEYAGDNDTAADIGSFIINCEHSREDVDRILTTYFQRELTMREKRHYYAYIAINGYFYFSWAIYKESTGQDLGGFPYLCYRYALDYGKLALSWYEEN